MARIIRGAPYLAEGIMIGETRREPEVLTWRMAPPPPPPEVPFDGVGPDAHPPTLWSQGPWSAGLDQPTAESEPHPDEIDAHRKLREAEQLVLEAHEEAERLLADARRQAAEIGADAAARADEELERARAAAREIQQSAAVAAEQVRAEAEQAGRAEGFARGEAEGMAHGHAEGLAKAEFETVETIGRVTQLAESAAVDRRELLHAAEDEVVRLAVQIAEKVLQREVQMDRRLINHMAELALQYVAVGGQVRLRVNPADFNELSAYWHQRHGEVEVDRSYEIVTDAEIGRGGVVIETRAGRVDARLETQLEEVARSLGAMPDDAMFAE